MSAALIRVKELLTQNGITTALVIDDSLDLTNSVVPLAPWMEVIGILAERHNATLDKIRELFESKGHRSIEIEPPADLINEIRAIVTEAGATEALQLLKGRVSTESELTSILEYLDSLEVPVRKYQTTDGVDADAHLIFVDFSIAESPDMAGTAATQFLRSLVERAKETKTIPAVFLMSRHGPTREEWEEVADQSSYLRFCFRYRDKAELGASPDLFLFHLEEILEAWPLAQQYMSHLTTVAKSLHTSIDVVIRDLMRLTPADFSSFATIKLHDESGETGARHLRYLTTQLLNSELTSSTEVSEALVAFGRTLASTPLRHTDHESVALHDLHGRVLYERSASTIAAPVGFGDIYARGEGEQKSYFMVLSPECDLEIRSDGKAKAERVLLLEGKVVDRPTSENYKEHTPLMREDKSAPCRWLSWNLRRPFAMNYDEVANKDVGGMTKWGCMAREHAEGLQQRFASDLLEVGTEDLIEGSWQHAVRVFGGRNGGEDMGRVTIAELRVAGKHLWALTGDANILFREDGERQLLTPEVVRELQVFTLVNKFVERCREERVLITEGGEELALVKVNSRAIDNWTRPAGLEAWTLFRPGSRSVPN